MKSALEASPPLKGRMLVIDDEPAMGNAIRRALPSVVLEKATCGDAALALLRRGDRFDVILCDIFMPGMSGVEVYRRIAELAPEQAERIIFITGSAADPIASGLLAELPNPCLEKPFQILQLIALCRTYLSAGGGASSAKSGAGDDG